MIDPAPGEDVSAALALVNTRYVDLGELVDDIADPDAAREWLASRAEAPRDMPLGNQEVVRVHELRAVVRELLCARSEGRAPREEALEELAEVTAAAPGSVRLTVRDGDLSSDWVAAGGDPLERALAWIAADAIALAGDPPAARPRSRP